MHLLLLFMMFQSVALGEVLPPVSTYAGESVTLPSGADPSWELTTITWSIWPNTTWIATYFKNKTKVDHFYKYTGRLHLNTKTGEFLISKVTTGDELEYTVDFSNSKGDNNVNKIQLNIKQRLNKPTIRTRMNAEADSCLLGLHCSSPDAGVTLSWKTEPHFPDYTEMNNNLFTILNKTHGTINFTCISVRNGDSKTETVSLKCEDPPPPVTSPSPVTPSASNSKVIHRDPVFLVPGLLVAAVVVCWYCYKTKKMENDRVTSEVNL